MLCCHVRTRPKQNYLSRVIAHNRQEVAKRTKPTCTPQHVRRPSEHQASHIHWDSRVPEQDCHGEKHTTRQLAMGHCTPKPSPRKNQRRQKIRYSFEDASCAQPIAKIGETTHHYNTHRARADDSSKPWGENTTPSPQCVETIVTGLRLVRLRRRRSRYPSGLL